MKKTSQGHLGAWANRVSILLLLVLALAYFAPLLSGSKMMYGSDWLLSGYTSRKWLADSIKAHGAAPLWNPNLFCGLPVMNPYSLLTLIYLLIPVHLAWTYLFVLSMFLAGLGMYLYLKELRLSSSISILCSMGYMSAGPLLSMTQPGHEGKILAAGLFPFILLFLHRGLERRRLVYFIFAGGMGGIAALHAHFQLTYYAGVVAVAYLLFHLVWERRENRLRGTLRLVGYSVVGGIFAGGLALMKFLPIFGSLRWGSRGGIERGYEFATSWSLPPIELLDLVTPYFSGLLGNYWGANYFKLDTQYLGILPLLLALLGVFFKYRERYVKFFLGLGVVAILFSLGGHTPFYKIPYYILPQISKFRAPSMAFYLVAFSVAVLAGYGLSALIGHLRSQRRLVLCLSVVFAAVLIAALVCTGARESILLALRKHVEPTLVGSYGAGGAQQKISSLYGNYPSFLKGLWISLLLIGINSLLIILLTVKRWKIQALVLVGLGTVLLADQWSIEKKFLRTVPHPDAYFARDEIVNFLEGDAKGYYRLFPLASEHAQDGYFMHHGIQSLGGYTANPYRRYQEYTGAGSSVLFMAPNLMKHRTLLDLLNARYVLSAWVPEVAPEQDARTQEMIETFMRNFSRQWGVSWTEVHEGLDLSFRSNRGAAIYRNPSALERVWLVPDYEVLPEEEIMERLLEPGFDPRLRVVLEEDPGIPHGDDSLAVGDVEITSYAPNRIECRAHLGSPGFLVLSENWHPDWKVYVDEEKSRILRANYLMRAVQLDPGEHEVVFVCRSTRFTLSSWVGLVTFLLLAGVFIYWVSPLSRRKSRG